MTSSDEKYLQDLNYEVGDIYRSGTNLYTITGHKPCPDCYLLRDGCKGKSIFTHCMSNVPYEVCGMQKLNDRVKKIHKKVEQTKTRW